MPIQKASGEINNSEMATLTPSGQAMQASNKPGSHTKYNNDKAPMPRTALFVRERPRACGNLPEK